MFANNIGPAIGIPLVMTVPLFGFFFISYFGSFVLMMLADKHSGDFTRTTMYVLGAIVGLVLLIFALVLPAVEAGVYACFLGGVRTRKLTADKLGAGFRQWWACTWVAWASWLATLICLPFVVVLVGLPALYAVQTVKWLALCRIVDKGQGGMEALAFAGNALQGRLWMMLLFTLLAITLMGAGASAIYLGILVTVPIGLGAMAAGYHALSARQAPSGNLTAPRGG